MRYFKIGNIRIKKNTPVDSNSVNYVDVVHNNRKLLSSSVRYNGGIYNITGKVRDTCLDNTEYAVDLKKYLGGGTYGMAFDGVLWESDNKSIDVAIKLYMDASDAEENIYNIVSGIFPNQVATFYKGEKCKIFNTTNAKIPISDFLRIVIMEKGTPVDSYLDKYKYNFDKFFDIVKKTAENCYIFNIGGFLHNDIKPGNCIISDTPTRSNLGGLLIDFGMTTVNKLRGLPPLDALYFLLTSYKFSSPKNPQYIDEYKKLCKPYYDDIIKTGITRRQLVTQNKNKSTTSHGKYDPNGLCSYDIENEFKILCPSSTDLYKYDKKTAVALKYYDFPVQINPVDNPYKKPVAKPFIPIAKPVAKPFIPVAKPVVKLVAKPVVKLVAKPYLKPAAKPVGYYGNNLAGLPVLKQIAPPAAVKKFIDIKQEYPPQYKPVNKQSSIYPVHRINNNDTDYSSSSSDSSSVYSDY